MAQSLNCQSDDGNLAIFIGTNLDTGESATLCQPCLIQFCGTIVEAMTGLPVNALLDDALVTESDPITDDEVVEAVASVVEHDTDDAHSDDVEIDAEHSAAHTK